MSDNAVRRSRKVNVGQAPNHHILEHDLCPAATGRAREARDGRDRRDWKFEVWGSKFRKPQTSRAVGQAPPQTAEPVPCEPSSVSPIPVRLNSAPRTQNFPARLLTRRIAIDVPVVSVADFEKFFVFVFNIARFSRNRRETRRRRR